MRTTERGHHHRPFVITAIAVALGVSCPPQRVEAQSALRPQFDIEGSWQADASRPMQCFRSELDVTCVMVNQGFSHQLNLSYVAPTRLEGMVTRRNRSNGCITHMNIGITMLSAANFTLTWRALDANCDLQVGQSAGDPPYVRLH